ncbi:21704_t:CDS:2 [Rhizophagus irregularis]|nr:21704_t:CDS:2 [Rhizophagus irregularis]
MGPEMSAKFIKHLFFIQILIMIGIGICEVVQLAEVNKSQQEVIQHPEDWDYLFGYTKSIARWKNIENYSDNSKNVTLLILWCFAIIPSVTILARSDKLRTCSESSYSYTVSARLLSHCNAYLASLFLAYIFIITVIIQLLFNFVVIKHQKEISMKPPPNLQEPKKIKVRRSKRVAKKRNSLRSISAYSASTRLSAKKVKNEVSPEMSVNENV